jgi:hypothetical protein
MTICCCTTVYVRGTCQRDIDGARIGGGLGTARAARRGRVKRQHHASDRSPESIKTEQRAGTARCTQPGRRALKACCSASRRAGDRDRLGRRRSPITHCGLVRRPRQITRLVSFLPLVASPHITSLLPIITRHHMPMLRPFLLPFPLPPQHAILHSILHCCALDSLRLAAH